MKAARRCRILAYSVTCFSHFGALQGFGEVPLSAFGVRVVSDTGTSLNKTEDLGLLLLSVFVSRYQTPSSVFHLPTHNSIWSVDLELFHKHKITSHDSPHHDFMET